MTTQPNRGFKAGDRVTTDDDPHHGATILSIDRWGMATIQFDQRHEFPYPPDEVDVGDLQRFTAATESKPDRPRNRPRQA